MGLSSQEVEAITAEVLQPYRIFWEKVAEFEQAVTEILNLSPQLNPDDLDDLRYFQRVLRLRDEDIAPILSAHHLTLDRPSETGSSTTVEPSTQVPTQAQSSGADSDTNRPQKVPFVPSAPPVIEPFKPAVAPLEDNLRSEKGIDYTRLRDLLKVQQWKEADLETYVRMLEAVGRKQGDYLRSDELKTFPCVDLKTIDSLWVKYSNGNFGFSVQKKIWQECGSPTEAGKDWNQFCVKMGWKNLDETKRIEYSKLQFSHQESPHGELPAV